MARGLELRHARSAVLGATFNGPVINFSIPLPGPYRNPANDRLLFLYGISAILEAIRAKSWVIRQKEEIHPPTGPEALIAVTADAATLKRSMIDLEDTHPLGQFFDCNVRDAANTPISRSAFSIAPRPCPVCGGQTPCPHPADAVQSAIAKAVAALPHGTGIAAFTHQ